jgi:hypothetical protein
MSENTTSHTYDAIVIGAGSIGKKHLKVVCTVSSSVLVVDPDPGVKEYLLHLPDSKKITYSESIKNCKLQIPPAMAVISNWGPDHFTTFLELVNLGVKNFVIEKPLTDSFYELDEMQKIVELYELNVKTNLPLIYSGLIENITKAEEFYDLGEPLAVNVFGGAKCIATIGIHYIALTNLIFNSRPISVTSSMVSSGINPRNSSFVYLEGNANWTYTKSKYLAINFVNKSQVDFTCKILYRHAELNMNSGTWTWSVIPKIKIADLGKPTKTAAASEQIWQIEMNSDSKQDITLKSLYNSFNQENLVHLTDPGFGATRDLLVALASSELGRKLALPINFKTDQYLYNKKWSIS